MWKDRNWLKGDTRTSFDAEGSLAILGGSLFPRDLFSNVACLLDRGMGHFAMIVAPLQGGYLVERTIAKLVLSNRRRCSRTAFKATLSRDRSFGGNPPWDRLSYASRRSFHVSLSLSLSSPPLFSLLYLSKHLVVLSLRSLPLALSRD